MKKLIIPIVALLAHFAFTAPMASQPWVSKHIERAKFDTESKVESKLESALNKLDNAIRLFESYEPSITNDINNVITIGTNDCYFIKSYTDTNFIDKLCVWDKISEYPREYYNKSLDLRIYRWDNYREITTTTNTFVSTTTKLETRKYDEIVAVTNSNPKIEYESTPIWGGGYEEERVYWIDTAEGKGCITNTVWIPEYIESYETSVVTNGFDTIIYTYTNTVYDYYYITNSVPYTKISVSTNVYNKIVGECKGEMFTPKNRMINWVLLSPRGEEMTLYKFDCTDAEWYDAMYQN